MKESRSTTFGLLYVVVSIALQVAAPLELLKRQQKLKCQRK